MYQHQSKPKMYTLKALKRMHVFGVLLVCIVNNALAQQASNIWVGKLKLEEKNPITDLIQITDNSEYTNQPYFFDNETLYFTQAVKFEGEEMQMDIMQFDFNTGDTKNITKSTQSEYSPTPLPFKQGMSVIRVNAQNKQELWEITPLGKPAEHFVPLVEPIGYQVWLNKQHLLLFVLGEPNTLQLVNKDLPDQLGTIVDTNIGASLQRYKDTDWFLYTSSNDGEFLNGYNASSQKTAQLFAMPNNIDYFTTTPNGYIVASNKKAIMIGLLAPQDNKLQLQGQWRTVYLKDYACSKDVSRIAVSPDMSMIALVCPAVP